MAFGYSYGGYPAGGGYYAPPMPDQLAQLRQNQYQQPMMQGNQQMQNTMQFQQPMVQQAVNGGGILWVNHEREAFEYPVAPNSAVALWDINNPVVYLKKADASGKPDTEIYDLVKRNPVQASPMPAQEVQMPQVD